MRHRIQNSEGTDVALTGVRDEDIELAKSFFLLYAVEEILDTD